jgi:hypothetical protein
MNTTETTDAGLLRRIAKLLAIAGDHRADPNEAAAAAAMAERIMRKHQIEHAEVLTASLARNEEEMATADVETRIKTGEKYPRPPSSVPIWGQWIAVAVAKLHDCEVRYGWCPRRGKVIRLFGVAADVQVASWTIDYIVASLVASSRAWHAAAPRSKADGDSFRKGYAQAVCAKIADMRRERQASPQMNALVVSKSQAIARAFGEFNYGKARAANITSHFAAAAGYAAGASLDLARRGVGRSGGDSTKLLGR